MTRSDCAALAAYRKMLTADAAIIVHTFIGTRFVEARSKSERVVDRLGQQTPISRGQQDQLDTVIKALADQTDLLALNAGANSASIVVANCSRCATDAR